MANLTRNVQQAIDWAHKSTTQQMGQGIWDGMCDRFVANVYGQSHSGYASAMTHWGSTPAGMKRAGDKNPPVGALVYWSTGKPAGHVAVVVGRSKTGEPLVATTHTNGGKPAIMPLSQTGMNYLGWAPPYFQGKTAKLDYDGDGVTEADPGINSNQGEPTYVYQNSGLPGSVDETKTLAGDLNGDGKVDKRDKELRQDELSMDMLQMDYETAWRVVSGNKELSKLFSLAVKEGWDERKFQVELEGTKWMQSQESVYAAKAWFAKQKGGREWEDQVDQAGETIQRLAASMGADIPEEELANWGEKYIFGGWMEKDREGLMMDALANYVDPMRGSAATVTAALKVQAEANGLKMNDQWYTDVARSIARGESSQEDWDMELRQQTAAANPLYADKIMAGATLKGLLSPYTSRMANILEIPEADIDYGNNPYLSQVLGQVDENGNPRAMSFTDFETMLRKDPRWLETQNGSETFMSTANKMMQDWGFLTNNANMVV